MNWRELPGLLAQGEALLLRRGRLQAPQPEARRSRRPWAGEPRRKNQSWAAV